MCLMLVLILMLPLDTNALAQGENASQDQRSRLYRLNKLKMHHFRGISSGFSAALLHNCNTRCVMMLQSTDFGDIRARSSGIQSVCTGTSTKLFSAAGKMTVNVLPIPG